MQAGGIGTREKAVVEALEPDPLALELLLDPLVPVETELDRVRQVGADLEERGPPFPVLDVEVIMLDRDRLAGEIEGDPRAGPQALVGLERAHLLLGHADDYDPVRSGEAPPVRGHDVILSLLRFEGNQRDTVLLGVGLNRADKALVARFEQRRRGNRLPEVLMQEVTEPP